MRNLRQHIHETTQLLTNDAFMEQEKAARFEIIKDELWSIALTAIKAMQKNQDDLTQRI